MALRVFGFVLVGVNFFIVGTCVGAWLYRKYGRVVPADTVDVWQVTNAQGNTYIVNVEELEFAADVDDLRAVRRLTVVDW